MAASMPLRRSNDPGHRPRHVLITGASSGIGAELARLYAAPGVRLSLTGRHAERLAAVAAACRERGAHVETAIVQIVDAEALAAWVVECDATQNIDLVVANAGIGGARSIASPMGEDIEAAREILTVNVLGVVNTVAPLIPRLAGRGHGQIAIMASIAALVGLPHSPAYCASKAAVSVYGDALRRLLLPTGVSVSVIYPGYVDTPMSASLPFERLLLWPSDKAARHIADQLAKGRRTIAFPRLLHWVIRASGWLPAALLDKLLAERARRDLGTDGR